MKYILLDTSVLVNCTLVNAADSDPELLVTIVDRMRSQGAMLLLPDVVRFEYLRKVPEELALIRKQTKKFRDSVTTSVLPAPDVSKIHETLDKLDADRDAAAKRAQDYFLQVASDPEIAVPTGLDGDAVAEAIGYVLSGKKPSKDPGRGLLDPDSLIVASAARFARTNGLSDKDQILICSDNHKDFARWDPDGKTHALADSISAAIPCEARYYKSPRLLLEQELEIVVVADKPLSDALDDYERLSETMSSIDRWAMTADQLRAFSSPALDSSILERVKRASALEASVLESISQGLGLDSSILERVKRASALEASALENISRGLGVGLDSSILEKIKRASALEASVLENISRGLGVGLDSSILEKIKRASALEASALDGIRRASVP